MNTLQVEGFEIDNPERTKIINTHFGSIYSPKEKWKIIAKTMRDMDHLEVACLVIHMPGGISWRGTIQDFGALHSILRNGVKALSGFNIPYTENTVKESLEELSFALLHFENAREENSDAKSEIKQLISGLSFLQNKAQAISERLDGKAHKHAMQSVDNISDAISTLRMAIEALTVNNC